ncbi:hypothetical protein JQC91_03370 [Jannaschia sp. Os4]|uniref:DUF2515 family protein n=1 Tax=Jannaschia sp. Os4 TaxID=2807617 RepID=UPI001939D498|nr:hypothetical protein [Jannaschia sp. Os4]MBM2575335.1 hypothetical protein [Jannaschia sp. Os4]
MPQDLPTTSSSAASVGSCPDTCEEAAAQVQDEVNRIKRIEDPIARNVAITDAYERLARDMPQNDWVRLASYVSVQGGCAMKEVTSGMAQVGRVFGINPGQNLEALKDANTTIFESIYPANRFVANCGLEKLKECMAEGAIEVPGEIETALEEMERGELRQAADRIARYEQVRVVQPVYDRHAEAFRDMARGEAIMPGDQTSIPVAKTCTRDDLVRLGDRDIANPFDRVDYYGDLIERMYEIEGIAR